MNAKFKSFAILIFVSSMLSACGSSSSYSSGTRMSKSGDLDRYESAKVLEAYEGKASYYHDSLAGNLTANGEVYRLGKFTAASRTLPFGTVIRVVRKDTGKSVIVRVNDRGPFGRKERILDLSRAAAESLGMIRAGVVPIRAEIVKFGDGKTHHRRR